MNTKRQIGALALMAVVVTMLNPSSAQAAGQFLTINTIAGTGSQGYSNGPGYNGGTIGVAAGATLSTSSTAVGDGDGNIYEVDFDNCLVRKINTAGLISDFAGNRTCGYGGDGGAPTSAALNQPRDVAIDALKNVYIADGGNCRVRKVSAGVISTVAGTGVCGFSGDNGPATAARLAEVDSVALDASGNLLIADTGNSRIRKVTGNTIKTIAGNGSWSYSGDGGPPLKAGLHAQAISVSAGGAIFIADRNNNRIRKIAGGVITTIAGNGTSGYAGDGGAATAAMISMPMDVSVDSAGTVFIADTFNCRIRKVSANVITTVAGSATCGDSGDGGPATSAQLGWVPGVSVDPSGTLLIAGSNKVKAVWGAASRALPSADASLNYMFASYGNTNNATNTNWSGGDATYSIKLPGGRIAWFFADSFLGRVNADHTRSVPGWAFINNQAVLQDTNGNLSNVFSGAAGTAFFPPDANGDYYWPEVANLKNSTTLQVLLRRVSKTTHVPNGVALATIAIGTAAAPTFTLSLPLTDISARAFMPTANVCGPSTTSIVYGNAVTYSGTDTYIYGLEGCGQGLTNYVYTAKVSGKDLAGTWSYFSGTPATPSWTTEASGAVRIQKNGGIVFADGGHESSVVKTGSTYRMISSPLSINSQIKKYTAPNPWGPWSTGTLVYTAPEWGQLDWGPGATCTHMTYNAKEHAEFNTSGKIVVSYNVIPDISCAGGITDLSSNVDNYRPRFVVLAA